MTSPNFYDSAARPPRWLEELIQLARYRDLIRELVSRNIKARYKRSALGLLWTMLNPIAMMLILSLVFSNLFSVTVPNYSIYLLAGLLFWNFFSQVTVASASELVWGASWANRIYVPKTVFAVAAVATGVLNLLLALVPLLLLMLALGVRPGPALLLLPLSIALGAVFTLGVALTISALAVRFVDFVEIYQIGLTAWLYLTPVIYPLEIIPAPYRRLFGLNPMLHLLAAFRAPICDNRLIPADTLMISTAVAFGTLCLGWWLFTKSADQIAYRT